MKSHKNIKILVIVIIALFVVALLSLFIPKAYNKKPVISKTLDSITHHQITIDGKKYPYTTRAGTITLYKNHKPAARMFYTADTLDNAEASKRPITFFSNGGPGASSMLLRMTSFGPKRVVLNDRHEMTSIPYTMIDNPYSLLDKTDLVFIDMPGTGYGRLTKDAKPSDFYTVDKDVEAFSTFIQQYIKVNHRWNSPKFLFGESYGTTRMAILTNQLQRVTQINGVILQSSILNYALMGERLDGGDWQYVLYLPSLAATAWHFHASDYHPESLETLMSEVKNFALTEYVAALAQGSELSEEKFEFIAQKLHHYLGLSIDSIRLQNLRISAARFTNQLLHQKEKKLGRFDSRFSFYTLNKGEQTSIDKREIIPPDPTDPSSVAIKTAVIAANNDYLYKDLKYQTEKNYITNLRLWPTWGFNHQEQLVVNASFDLASALVENPNLRVFSANGYYDLATPFFATNYALKHLNLSPELQTHIAEHNYSAGHMIYAETSVLKQYKQDLADWYDATLNKTKVK